MRWVISFLIFNLRTRNYGWEGISRSYARLIAEFLNEESPVHLRLLASPTCVGLRYGFRKINSRSFSRKTLRKNWPNRSLTFRQYPNLAFRLFAGFAKQTILDTSDAKPLRHSFLFSSSLHRNFTEGLEY